MEYIVHQGDFEGPLDVLLALIEKQKLDICEISLLKIIDDYLAYVQDLDVIVVEGSFFLEIASQLMLIKSIKCLPRISEEQKNEVEEKLEDITERLRVYKEIKEREEDLVARYMKESCHHSGGQKQWSLPDVETTYFSDPYRLIKIYSVLAKKEKFQQSVMIEKEEDVSVEDTVLELSAWIKENQVMSFSDIIKKSRSRLQLVCRFLAILELLKNRVIQFVPPKKNEPYHRDEQLSLAFVG